MLCRAFRQLTDKSRSRWLVVTLNRAPHKPLLLVSMLDLFELDEVASNLIELTPDLDELFARYWARVSPFDRRGRECRLIR